MFDECDFIGHVIMHSWFYGRADGHGAFLQFVTFTWIVL